MVLKFIPLLILIWLVPISASGYEFYELESHNKIEKNPTVCYISFDFPEEYENVTKQAPINDWTDSLQQYTDIDNA